MVAFHLAFSKHNATTYFYMLLSFSDLHYVTTLTQQTILNWATTGPVPICQYCSNGSVPANGTSPVLACTQACNWPSSCSHYSTGANTKSHNQNSTKPIMAQYWANTHSITGPVQGQLELTRTKTLQNQYWPSTGPIGTDPY